MTFTICPGEAGSDININFAAFDVESNNDILRVYQGTTTSGTLIGSYHNNNLPPTNITSTDASGCLTFHFTVSCILRPPALKIDDVSVDEDAGTMVFTVAHTGLPTSGPFSVTFNTVDGTSVAGTDYVANSGTLNFDGSTGDTEQITVTILDDTRYDGDNDFTMNF